MKRYLLDANICIAILKKDPNVAKAPHGKYVDQHVGSFIDNLTVIPIGASIDLPTTLLW